MSICNRLDFHHENIPFRNLKDPQATRQAMLNTKITSFPGHIQSIYYQSILKIFTYIVVNDETVAKELVSTTVEKMTVFLSSGDVEAQERVCSSRLSSINTRYSI